MFRHLFEKFERDASDFCKRDVSLSEESFYSGELRSYYKKLVVDGKETRHHIDLFQLQEANGRGRLNEKIRTVAGLIILG